MIGSYPEFFSNVIAGLGANDAQKPDHPGIDEDRFDASAPLPDTHPAPWARGEPLFIEDDDDVTRVDVALDARDLLDPDAVQVAPDQEIVEWWFLREKSRARGSMPADAIAVYRPWHLHAEHWGIYVSAEALAAFAGALSTLTSVPPARIAPLALRQILEHEWTHFAFEIAGTEIEDVLGRLVYPDYVLNRFSTPVPRWSNGPLEEIVASWAEVTFARHPPNGFKSRRPRNYARAVERLLSLCAPGYRDWHWMEGEADAVKITAGVASLIAAKPMRTFRWTEVTQEEKSQVPVYWIGDRNLSAAFGAFPKSAGPPAIKRVEKWLRSVLGAREIRGRGKGSHKRWELPNGRPVGFATSAGFLLPPEAKDLAEAVGLTRSELFEHISAMRKPALSTS